MIKIPNFFKDNKSPVMLFRRDAKNSLFFIASIIYYECQKLRYLYNTKSMKMKVKFVCMMPLLLGVVIVAGCSRKEKTEVLATRIQYDVPVSSNDPQLDWWVNNLEGSRRDPFVKRLIEAAEKGEVQAYDYFNEPLTPEQVISLRQDTIFERLVREYPPYEEYDTMIIQKTDYRDVVKIRFLEEWKWDPDKLTVEKRVIGISPVAVKEFGGAVYNRPLFWIYTDKNYPGGQ